METVAITPNGFEIDPDTLQIIDFQAPPVRPVLGADGVYHARTADGPLLVVKISPNAVTFVGEGQEAEFFTGDILALTTGGSVTIAAEGDSQAPAEAIDPERAAFEAAAQDAAPAAALPAQIEAPAAATDVAAGAADAGAVTAATDGTAIGNSFDGIDDLSPAELAAFTNNLLQPFAQNEGAIIGRDTARDTAELNAQVGYESLLDGLNESLQLSGEQYANRGLGTSGFKEQGQRDYYIAASNAAADLERQFQSATFGAERSLANQLVPFYQLPDVVAAQELDLLTQARDGRL